jgi:hypothetical protein
MSGPTATISGDHLKEIVRIVLCPGFAICGCSNSNVKANQQ